jgi:hypothetical protein
LQLALSVQWSTGTAIHLAKSEFELLPTNVPATWVNKQRIQANSSNYSDHFLPV